jgi:monoamine oxidase
MEQKLSSSSEDRKLRIVVVGAGAAGIGAAQTLAENGFDPIILEARDRIGGRIYQTVLTKNLTNNATEGNGGGTDSIVVQLGANWMHGLNPVQNPLHSIATQLKLTLHQTSSDDEPTNDVLMFDKVPIGDDFEYQRLDPVAFQLALTRYKWVREQLLKTDPQCECSLYDIMINLIHESEHESFDFGPCSGLEWRVLNWLMDRISIDIASSIKTVSIRSMLEGESDGLHGEAVIQEGYSRVLSYITEKYSLKILRERVVTSILAHETHVVVSCTDGAIFEADGCVVAVPLGVLQDKYIEFDPPLPLTMQKILRQVSCGLANIVWLWFPHSFWPEGYNFVGLTRGCRVNCDFSTFLIPKIFDASGKRLALLMGQVCGDFAAAVESMEPSAVAAHAVAQLRAVFGPTVPDCIGCISSAWRKDQFARGSWSYFDVHTPYDEITPEEQDADSEQSWPYVLGDVAFAGEYLSVDNRGTVNGAYGTGVRAAHYFLGRTSNRGHFD